MVRKEYARTVCPRIHLVGNICPTDPASVIIPGVKRPAATFSVWAGVIAEKPIFRAFVQAEALLYNRQRARSRSEVVWDLAWTTSMNDGSFLSHSNGGAGICLSRAQKTASELSKNLSIDFGSMNARTFS